MNGLPYYKAYPRDFIEGTIGMSFELKAAYRLVLDLIYMQGGNLPDDARYISGLLGCTMRKWNVLRDELVSLGKIGVTGEFLTNKRAVIELETLAKLQEKQAERASTPRKNNDLQKPRLSQPEPDTDNTSSLRSDVKAQAPAKASVKSELMNVLDEDHSQAVIDHRKAIKKPMTVRAAQLLAGKFAKCQNPNAAADMMISAGWQGFEPEWVENRKTSSRNEPPPKPSGSTNPRHQMWVEDLIEQNEPSHEPVSQAGNVYDLSHGEGYIRSDGGPDIRLAFASNGKW